MLTSLRDRERRGTRLCWTVRGLWRVNSSRCAVASVATTRCRCTTSALARTVTFTVAVVAVILACTDGETTWDVAVVGATHGCGTPQWLPNGHRGRKLAMRSVKTCLDEVLALWLRDEGLQLGGGERIDQAGLGDDEQKHLCASEGRKLVGLGRDGSKT